ncbi:exosortase C-terminal domain/associated protein EpsI [Desulfatitalea tepidiphila]|uniref:exosortase C-terminal domain/associated protein EpsI n=1 Tax=Desulfatitalea tepidiphila TaxID=1185843 RepID=UPI0006B64F06|nr:exosortase C-terminal domain/associated protein EpsI [Desulfatitalea tepidiphila]
MEKIRNRYLIIIGALALMAVTINCFDYDVFSKADEGVAAINNIPKVIDGWLGTDSYLEPSIYEILETKSIIHRNYKSNQGEVFLSLVYYPDTKVDLHAPEACLGGAGERLLKSPQTLEINSNRKTLKLEVNQLVTNNGNFSDLVFYFYKSGSYMGRSYFKLRLNIAKNKLVSSNKSGALIRVSTRIQQENVDLGSERLTRFLGALVPFLVEFL